LVVQPTDKRMRRNASEHRIAARNMSLDARQAESCADRDQVALRERAGSPTLTARSRATYLPGIAAP